MSGYFPPIDIDSLEGNSAADLLARANHTGTQLAATISDLESTIAALHYLKSETDALVDGTIKAFEAYDPAGSGNFPATYGGDAVQKGDAFKIATADTLGSGTLVNAEDSLYALIDTPGQTDANWLVLESNRDQATESIKGVAKIASQATTDTGTNDTDMLTALKGKSAYQRRGIQGGNAVDINGARTVIVGDSEDSQFANITDAITAIATDLGGGLNVFGTPIPTGAVGNLWIILDKRDLFTEPSKVTIPPGIYCRSISLTIVLADTTTDSVLAMGFASGFEEYLIAHITGANPVISVDVTGFVDEFPTYISGPSTSKDALIIGGTGALIDLDGNNEADAEVHISNFQIKGIGAPGGAITSQTTFQGTVICKDVLLNGLTLGTAAGTGDLRVRFSNASFKENVIFNSTLNGFDWFGGTIGGNVTFAANANDNRLLYADIIGDLTDNSTAGTLFTKYPKVRFEPARPTPPAHSEGVAFYDKVSHSLSYYNDESDVTVNLGRETLIRVKNETAAQIDNGGVVHFTGVDGVEKVPTIVLSKADVIATGKANGVATHDIGINDFGYVTVKGVVHDLDTSVVGVGFVWLSPTVAGGLTSTEPSSPNQKVLMGFVTVSDGSVGQLVVDIENISLMTVTGRFGWAVPETDNAVLTRHDIVSAKEDRLSGVTVDGTPTTQNHDDANSAHVLIEVTTMTASGSIRLTGKSLNIETGVETPGDTEDIVIGATGWYESIKHWRETVVLSSVDDILDVDLNSFFWHPRQFEQDFIIDRVHVDYKTTAVSNTSIIEVQKYVPLTGFIGIFDETVSDIASLKSGGHHRESINGMIAESAGERLHIFSETKRLTDYRFEVRGEVV